MELFTKKNILTLSVVAVGILATIGIGSLVLRQIRVSSRQEIIRKNQELGANDQELSKHFLEALKSKDKEKLKIMYCPAFGHRFGEKAEQEFSEIWDKVQSQDYSDSNLKMEQVDENNGYRMIIENVKKDQETVIDYYATSLNNHFEGKNYSCFLPLYPED